MDRYLRIRLTAFAIAVSLSACSDTGPTDQGGSATSVAGQRWAGQQQVVRTLADEYRGLAARAPGFAGVYFDSVGRFTVAVATDRFSDAARDEVLRWTNRYTPAVTLSTPVLTRRVRYDYLVLDRHYQPLIMQLGPVPFVTSTRIDEVRARIVITVESPADCDSVRRVAASLGIPEDMMDVDVLRHAERIATLQQRVRPVYGGLQIDGNLWRCTLGFNGYAFDYQPVFMTASHCADVYGTVTGHVWGQETVASRIGVEIHQAPIFSGGQCPYSSCQLADVAVGLYDAGVSQGYGIVEKTREYSIVITGTYGVSGQLYGAITGEKVWKVGRTTGTSTGTILSSCVNVPPHDGYAGVLCAQKTNLRAGPGDSGAPVFMPYDPAKPATTPRTVGVLFAIEGSVTYHSRMDQIFSAQGYQFLW